MGDDRIDQWEILSLADAGISLIDCVHKTPTAQQSGLPYVAIPQMKVGHLDLGSARRISESDFVEWTRKALPQANDVVLSRRCNPGTTAAVKNGDRFALGQNLVLLRADGNRVYPPFLRWLVRGHDWWNEIGRFLNVGAVFDSLRCADVPKFELPIPPLDEQQAIASVLGSLDDKIELNRRMNRTLEQMAAAIFKAWFVDFEPVRAKASGAASFPGMPQPVFDALPATFADSELGPIPEGWEVAKLGEQAEVIKGRSYKSSELEPSSTALVTLKSIRRGGGYRPDGLKPYTGIHKPAQVVSPGELVVAYTDLTQAAEVIGKPAIVRGDSRYETLVASLDLGIIRPTNGLSVPYLYCLFRTDDFQTHVYGHTNGSTVLHLGKDGLPSYLMPFPPQGIQNTFDAVAVPAFQQIEAMSSESATLAETRDALLPKLLSGVIRIKGVQQ